MQLLPHLYQISGTVSGLSGSQAGDVFDESNVYCLDAGSELILIDSGSGDHWDQMMQNMKMWGLDPKKITTCLFTHAHYDHAGSAHRLREMGVTLYAHSETVAAIESGDHRCAGFLYHKEFVPTKIDHTVVDGDTIRVGDVTFEAIHLPGHTAGCTAYRVVWEGKTVLFSGDVIGTLGYGHFGWDGSYDFDKEIYLKSLIKMSKLSFDIMLGGHGVGSFVNPIHRVQVSLNEALIAWR
jgi:glyoxylase-like metal-dependent hydrolase (beta-lactamase superfamily II)